ncbi:MAG TPA: phasin family protein [Usitatibacter sp.]|nr:phasin family protein [Usitatibacter sp.]
MPNTANPIADLATTTMESATRFTRISMDGAERAISLQLEFAKGALSKATTDALALAHAKDVQELIALRTRMAEASLESLMGYSRSLYEVASETQSEFGKFAEERLSSFQQAVTDGVDQAAKSAPAGSDVAVAAIKSSLAATTAAFDSFSKAAKHAASLADASVRAGGSKPRKK